MTELNLDPITVAHGMFAMAITLAFIWVVFFALVFYEDRVRRRTIPTCSDCGSREITGTANVVWNPKTADFEKAGIYHDAWYCEACNMELKARHIQWVYHSTMTDRIFWFAVGFYRAVEVSIRRRLGLKTPGTIWIPLPYVLDVLQEDRTFCFNRGYAAAERLGFGGKVSLKFGPPNNDA